MKGWLCSCLMISGSSHYYSKTILYANVLNAQQRKLVKGNINIAGVSSLLSLACTTGFLSCLCFKMLTEWL